jgi:hypothetical protein
MSQQPSAPWIHIGECPVCADGLCRVRCSVEKDNTKRLYAMCDECEAIWLEPTTTAAHHFPDAEEPLCPLTGVPLYGSSSRWATTEDIRGTKWENEVIVDLPLDIGTDSEGMVTGDDIAGALDVPPIDPALNDDSRNSQSRPEDLAYGKDEPRPGC